MKKFVSMFLALVMCLTLTAPVYALEESNSSDSVDASDVLQKVRAELLYSERLSDQHIAITSSNTKIGSVGLFFHCPIADSLNASYPGISNFVDSKVTPSAGIAYTVPTRVLSNLTYYYLWYIQIDAYIRTPDTVGTANAVAQYAHKYIGGDVIVNFLSLADKAIIAQKNLSRKAGI